MDQFTFRVLALAQISDFGTPILFEAQVPVFNIQATSAFSFKVLQFSFILALGF